LQKLRGGLFEEIVDEADLLHSLALSIREAAYRRDSSTVALHIAELRMTGLALVKAYRQLRDQVANHVAWSRRQSMEVIEIAVEGLQHAAT
jgi:hypothetical protein